MGKTNLTFVTVAKQCIQYIMNKAVGKYEEPTTTINDTDDRDIKKIRRIRYQWQNVERGRHGSRNMLKHYMGLKELLLA